MKASVIIPTYNRSELLEMTISSLVDQDIGKENYEVIVIDDGSSDNTREVVESFKGKVNIIYYWQEDKGYRVSLARNEGIKRSSGEILIFLDTGMVVAHSYISSYYAAHLDGANSIQEAKHRKAIIGYVFGYDPENFSPDCIPEIVNFNDPDTTLKELARTNQYQDTRYVVYDYVGNKLKRLPGPWTIFWTTNVSVERTLMLEAGCFDEGFVTWGVEDVECGYRLFKSGGVFELSTEASGIHYPHARTNNTNHLSNECNKRRFYQKFPCAELELFISSGPLHFNRDYENYVLFNKQLVSLPKFSELITTEAANTLSNMFSDKKNIVFGCQDGFLLEVCKSAAGIEKDVEMAAKARANNPNADVQEFVGCRTFYGTKQFEVCLIAGCGLGMPVPFITGMVREAERIAKKVYWLRTSRDAEIAPLELNQIHDLGNGVTLHEAKLLK